MLIHDGTSLTEHALYHEIYILIHLSMKTKIDNRLLSYCDHIALNFERHDGIY